jgi:hypothetical protein
MDHPQLSRPARRGLKKERLRRAGRGRPSEDPQLRRMLTSHIHCGQDMELIIVHPAPPNDQTTAKNNRRLHTYRCECGFSFDQRSD